jgi:hypothetical protein
MTDETANMQQARKRIMATLTQNLETSEFDDDPGLKGLYTILKLARAGRTPSHKKPILRRLSKEAERLANTIVPVRAYGLKPAADYVSKQNELRSMPAGSDTATHRHELERQFMTCWGFQPDLRKQAAKLHALVCNKVDGFDHSTFYWDAQSALPVIVTQPHYDPTEKLEAGLRLGNWLRAEIVRAHEWSFYHPATGYLVIVKFPVGYASAIRALRAR